MYAYEHTPPETARQDTIIFIMHRLNGPAHAPYVRAAAPAHSPGRGSSSSGRRLNAGRLLVGRVYAPHGPVSGVPQKHSQLHPAVIEGFGLLSLFFSASSHVSVPSSRSDPIGKPSTKTALGPVGHSHAWERRL